MISLLTTLINALGNALVYLLKAVFSLLTWFIGLLFKALKVFFVIFPVTTVLFVLLLCANIYFLCTGSPAMPAGIGVSSVASMYTDLVKWWNEQVSSLRGTPPYYLFIFLTIMMFIPVVTVLLGICVFLSHGKFLFAGVLIDAAIYVFFSLFGKSIPAQARGRYFRLFPKAGKRHEERYHDRLLRQRNRQLEKEIRKNRASKRAASFYEDETYDEDDAYDEED